MALSLKNKQLEGRPLKLGGGARSGTGASYREAERAEESAFEAGDYHNFDTHLGEETRMAMAWAGEGNFRSFSPPTVGCEVESCLMDGDGAPLPESAQFLQYFSNDNGYYEMSKYNVEFEIDPVRLDGTPFSALCDSLENNRLHASRCADLIEARVASFGILPSLTQAHFTPEMLADRRHFQDLGNQLQKLGGNRPFKVNIGHGDGVCFESDSLSIEGASSSLQIHMSVSEEESAAVYNAAQTVSAMMTALCANSPFLTGRRLWMETRVPLFEQIMYERFGGRNAPREYGRRFGEIFGGDYLGRSVMELFAANYANFPSVLPIVREEPADKMMHLILHNRDILRWNRPILDFFNGRPFLRIENRTASPGPTSADMTANIAFYTGLVLHLRLAFAGEMAEKTKRSMPFADIRDNFYRAARDGLDADVKWLGQERNLRELILKEGMSYARRGLREAGVDDGEIAEWLDIVEQRARGGQTGAEWQIRHIAQHGGGEEGMRQMAVAYWGRQEAGRPVHTWEV